MTDVRVSTASESMLVTTDSVGREEWDAFVQRSDDASFCHLWGWREIIHGVMGHEPVFRVARSGAGAIQAAQPLYRVRTRLLGSHLVSVPFMNYGGPCGEPRARQLLAAWALDEAQRSRTDSLVLRTRREVPGLAPESSAKVTVVLPLDDDADRMWTKRFDAKFRNKIKRPQRDGMETRFGPEHLGAFYDVFAKNMRDLGTPVLPREFFSRIVDVFPQLPLIGATYWNGRPVAAGFGFMWRDEFEMTWSSSLKELRASKPNMLLYWDYMRELIGRGIRRFNFGRSTPGTGPHEFKLSWGAKDETLPWIHWPHVTAGASESRAATMAASVWRHLPLSLTNALGPTLARQLPWW
jgi:FemAB-related protein (PEP-CTERM system-associated)